MYAKEESLTFIKNQNIYIIPFFQRGYVWKEDNWKDLWDELTSIKKDCFLGSIILKDAGENRDGFHEKTIIDGQQRLTTLSVVIRALNDTFNKKYNKEGIDSLYKPFLFFTKQKRTETGTEDVEYRKLVPSKNDLDIFDKVINGEFVNNYNDEEIKHPIYLCYSFFRKQMEDVDLDTLERIDKKLTVDDRKIIVKIDLDIKENEQVIFDTINSAGVKLTSADIIKNALYQKLKVDGPNGDNNYTKVYKYYETTWYEHFEKDDKLKDWLEDRTTGRIIRTSLDMFLQAFAIINDFYDPQKDTLQDLPDKYKEELEKRDIANTKKLINSLCDYADIYYDNFVGFDSTVGLQYTDYKKRILHMLHEMDTSTFDAYILKVFKEENDEKQKNLLFKLESYIIRNYIIGNTTNIKNYNKDSIQLIKGTSSVDEWLKRDDVTDSEVKIGLKNIKNEKAKLILFWLQLFRLNNENNDMQQTTMVYNFQLEHVMPQKWKENWDIANLPVYDENGVLIDDNEKASEYRAAKIYEIGNMTLLRSKLNKTLSNRKFSEKVNGCTIRNKFVAGMKANCSLTVTSEITSLDSWDERTITSRTNKLYNEIISIWPTKFES